MPRELNLVPARLQDSLEMTVKVDGRLLFRALRGEEEVGMVTVDTNPLMADVRIRDESSMDFSCAASRERNLMRGSIM